jgi:hypothetical protein
MTTLFTILVILATLWGLGHVVGWIGELLLMAYSPRKRRLP